MLTSLALGGLVFTIPVSASAQIYNPKLLRAHSSSSSTSGCSDNKLSIMITRHASDDNDKSCNTGNNHHITMII